MSARHTTRLSPDYHDFSGTEMRVSPDYRAMRGPQT